MLEGFERRKNSLVGTRGDKIEMKHSGVEDLRGRSVELAGKRYNQKRGAM